MTYGELEKQAKGQLTKMEIDYLNERYTVLQRAIDNNLNKSLLDAEAKSRGLADADALMNAEVNEKYKSVTDEELQAFFKQNERRFGGKPLEEVKDKASKALLDTKKREAMQTLIDSVRTKNEVKVLLAPPALPKVDVSVDDDPIRGSANAPITIIEFADFQCPYCSKTYPTVKDVLKKYEGKVRFVYRDYVLPFHKRAMPAAIAASCAGKQNKYWEMHDMIYENQKAIEDTDLESYASKIGLDMASWKTCLTDQAVAEEITRDMTAGQEAGVSGTPAFFVNGSLLSGAVPVERFYQAIDQELAGK